MANWTDLFVSGAGGFSGFPYTSNIPIDVSYLNNATGSSAGTNNRDYLHPFIVRADVSIDAVWWQRINATAANVYVGIYDVVGTLLTDCAVDSNTTAGLHAVSTTPVTLTAGDIYYFAINNSAAVAANDLIAAGDPEFSYQLFTSEPALDRNMTSTVLYGGLSVTSFYKGRTAAALPSTQTMNSWTQQAFKFMGGFVPV